VHGCPHRAYTLLHITDILRGLQRIYTGARLPRRRHHAPTIVLERLPVGADRRRGIDGRCPADRGSRRTVRRGRGDVRPAAERHGERADQPERSQSGAGPGRRAVPDNVHGRRAVAQLGVCRRRVRTPPDRSRVHRVQVQQPAQAGRQEVSVQNSIITLLSSKLLFNIIFYCAPPPRQHNELRRIVRYVYKRI